jgi:urease accessory protein UreF
MRDQRLVQRYLDAVQRDEAAGWHTLVYGVTLAVYSVPLRPGLFGYAQQTTLGFIQSAARDLSLSETDCGSLYEELSVGFPAAVDGLLTNAVA